MVVVWTAACGVGAGGSGIEVTDAVLGATGATDAATYLVLHNRGPEDRLVGVDVDRGAGVVTMHRTETSGGRSRMQRVESMAVPADGELRLEPGGSHLMVQELSRPVEVGDVVRFRLRFDRSPDVMVRAEAVPLAALPERLNH